MRNVDQLILQNMRHGERKTRVRKRDYVPADQREGWNPKCIEKLPGPTNASPRQVVWLYHERLPK